MPAQVGIFDSGVGGLTVVRELHRRAEALPIRYVADTAFFPYGDRSPGEVQRRSLILGRAMMEQGCTVLVVACNTASSAALEQLRAALPIPVVGMEPPLKPAVNSSRSGHVVVLATEGTVAGERLARLEQAHSSRARVTVPSMPGRADLIERGEVLGEELRVRLRSALAGPISEGVDALALGCTHYGFITPILRAMLPPDVAVIDAAAAVARRTIDVIGETGLEGCGSEVVSARYHVTGEAAPFRDVVAKLAAAGERFPPMTECHARMDGVRDDDSDRGTGQGGEGAGKVPRAICRRQRPQRLTALCWARS